MELKAHEISCTPTKGGKSIVTSVAYYEANSSDLKLDTGMKEKVETIKKDDAVAREKMATENKKKMEKDALKNKAR